MTQLLRPPVLAFLSSIVTFQREWLMAVINFPGQGKNIIDVEFVEEEEEKIFE